MISSSKMLTIAVIALGILAIFAVAYTEIMATRNSYNSNIKISFSKLGGAYDYSCQETDYEVIFNISNIGLKNVVGLSVSITNPACVASLSSVPQTLNATSSFSLVAETTGINGTLTISGNNTLVEVQF